jgi:hypothetical protein
VNREGTGLPCGNLDIVVERRRRASGAAALSQAARQVGAGERKVEDDDEKELFEQADVALESSRDCPINPDTLRKPRGCNVPKT